MGQTGRAAARIPGVRRVDFSRMKYGRELAIDARFLSQLPAFDRSERPYYLTYYDIMLVTRGRGTFVLDGVVYDARPGTVFFTRPGEIRQLRIPDLDGACLFFAEDFVEEAFADTRFLGRFGFFDANRPSGALELTSSQRATFLARFRAMDREFGGLRDDAPHLLRAVLYELLVLLNRWYVARHGECSTRTRPSVVQRYLSVVERELSAGLSVAACARRLGISSGHLGALCRDSLGRPAGQIIRDRLMLEATRLLLYTDEPAASIAYRLGYLDPAYFGRCFRRATGLSPRRFRLERLPTAARVPSSSRGTPRR